MFLFSQLSRSCHAAVLPARWTDCPPHRRLPSWSLNGDLPWASQLQGADALPGYNVSAHLSPFTHYVRLLNGQNRELWLYCTSYLCVWPFCLFGHPKPVWIYYRLKCVQIFHVSTLYPSSYCSPEYTFPRQQEVIRFAASSAFELVTLNPRTLVVCGSYSVGKEKVFLGELKLFIPRRSMWHRIFH